MVSEYIRVGALSHDKLRLQVTDFRTLGEAEAFVLRSYRTAGQEWSVTLHTIREKIA